MERITSFQFLQNAFNFTKSLDKKCISNYYFNFDKSINLIEANELFHIKIGNVIFVFRQNKGFHNLYYYAPSFFELKESLGQLQKLHSKNILIVDIVTTEVTTEVLEIFKTSGFFPYSSLVRMSRISQNEMPIETIHAPNLKVANRVESIEVYKELCNHFDPMAEQIPALKEIIDWGEKGNILIYKIDNSVAGFIIYQLVGLTLYLRYWFVATEFRDRKIGSSLFQYFLSKGKNAKRQLFWVIQSNENAVVRYKHYGFKDEKMYNYVLINKKMRNRIVEILTEIRPEFDFSENLNFIENGMLDSFDVVQLVVSLDDEYNISIDGIDIIPENFSTVDAILKLLTKYGIEE